MSNFSYLSYKIWITHFTFVNFFFYITNKLLNDNIFILIFIIIVISPRNLNAKKKYREQGKIIEIEEQ